ncbi:MAG TPA: EAL domain-containing protein [Aurantimonas coralicida]|uniref:EAL domain-containing protein n=2 Tax=root TaxID=1 RepID=A0A9C9NEG4_9HYPH|nr:EAL domain-containing protein [Aurantimonas coralicida]HEU00026.1 EAL domain-containing protein [Aurantimonas coralicida]
MRLRLIQALLAVTVGCFVLATAYISHLITERQTALREISRYNIVWSVNQALVEFTRLQQRVAESAVAGSGVDADEVALRVEILLGRLDILDNGEAEEYIRRNPENVRVLGRLEETLVAAEPLLGRLGEPGTVLALNRLLSPLHAELASLASDARQTGDRRIAEDQGELRRLHRLFTGLAAGLILCGIALILLLLWSNRLLARSDTKLRQDQLKIVHMARHDPLTGLANRLRFNDELEACLNHANCGASSLTIMFLDLDCFKDINDTHGHLFGDEVLKAVADRLRRNIRDDNLVARLGGDEFAILLPPSRETRDCAGLASRLIAAISAPFAIDGVEFTIAVSIGIAELRDRSAEPGQLLKQADLALYQAKGDGRGIFRFFEPKMEEDLLARKSLEAELRNALGNGELEVFYQPVIEVARDAICGFEALMRWRHPERGMVPPAEFIPLAEDLGLIVQLGEWVLRQACAEAASWPSGIRIAVNLSPVQFRNKTLVQTVVSALAASGLAPSRLELEVTETVLLDRSDRNIAILHQLRGLGVRIAMDDFGTGYSSLSYLNSFPFDKIKIDQSFVRGLTTSADSLAIVRLVAGLGFSLGMTTTAEGVETEDEYLALKAAGCIEVQGYYFGRPKPASQIELDRPRSQAGSRSAA